ncbi:magnesium transporter MRS2-5-like isoform X1 [Salvia hispanica]|uniref:magnesium transporter MRS2-5-like isoform X1 n=1 Tax=Salvia hispanica TaxID=49212 RepID=UPI00200992C9|nr:magnesium transporter MRS2-5-like isoform X1 [Salvia hispanica]XP_047968945.1 magnesium transporter MRS2-5-like isoform X1 [Salvia hispanica]
MAQPFGADYSRYYANGIGRDNARGPGFPGLKKRNHHLGNRSWILIDTKGNSEVMELDKPTVMRRCLLPSRDLRLLDPLFIHPSSILGRDKAIVVSLEQIRCIITADEVILKNSVEDSVLQYKYELCKRLEVSRDNYDDLPFEFRALEVALEHTCMSLDAQTKDLELDIYPVLDELASFISTLNLERVRRFKGSLLALTQRVQKVCDEIEHLMNDDGDMAEMFLTEKKERRDILTDSDVCNQINDANFGSKYAPVSAVGSSSGVHRLQRAFSTMSSTKHGSFSSSSSSGENTDQLEMLLEAYFVGIDNTLNKLLSLKEYIDDTEDLINIKLGNVQNQLIKFELLLRAATFVTAMFAAVAAVFGMNFEDTVFDEASTFNWVLVISGICCGVLYGLFLAYFRNKKVIP